MTGPLASAAADYLARGLPVIALTGKTPNVKVHRHGLSEPIVGAPETAQDRAFLDSVFEHPDTTGVAIVIPYPYVVVDIDGEEGAVALRDLTGGIYATRWVAKTGRGLHLWFSCATPTGSMSLGPKLDLKGQSSYVAAPPSRHPDGGTYEWLAPPDGGPPEAPEAIERLIEEHASDRAAADETRTIRRNAWGQKYAPGDTVFYAQASHEALIEGMTNAGEGNRNNYLHWAAATLAEEAGSDEEFDLLAQAALDGGLEPIEVKRTIRSARKAHG